MNAEGVVSGGGKERREQDRSEVGGSKTGAKAEGARQEQRRREQDRSEVGGSKTGAKARRERRQ